MLVKPRSTIRGFLCPFNYFQLHFYLIVENVNLLINLNNLSMKIKSFLVIALLLIFIKANADEIKFINGTYAEVLSKAKAENKVLMVDFFTDWCKWCVELDKKVYTNSEVADFANKNQVNWKIDAEKGEGIELAKKFQVSGYPTVVFVDGNGDEIDRIVGYLPVKDFLPAMKDFVSGKNTLKSLQATLSENANDIEANFRLGKKMLESGNAEDAKKYLEKVISMDSENNSGWTDDAELYLAQISGKKDDIDAFVNKYPKSDLTKQALIFLAESTMENNDYATGDKYYDELILKYGNSDEEVSFSYGQYLLSKIYGITKNENISKEMNLKGIELANKCLGYVKGSVNEASCYYYLSMLNLNLGNKTQALDYIDKAISIFDRKSFRELKDKINK